MKFGSFLIALVPSLIGKILLSLGFAVVTITGVGTLEASDTSGSRVTSIGRAGFWRNALDTDTTGQQLDSFELSEISSASGGIGFGIGTFYGE